MEVDVAGTAAGAAGAPVAVGDVPPGGDVPDNAAEHCPGTESEMAGKSSSCDGCPNQAICAASTPAGPDPDLAKIADRMKGVHHKLLVFSGKGGVGKSTVSAQLSWALSADDEDTHVGLMDVDICGPSIPKIMGLEGESVHSSNSGWSPVYVEDNLAVMSVGFLLPNTTDAVIWRGPKKNGLIKQFLKDVAWGELDYLIVDTPPGTSDEHISLAQYLGQTGPVDGAVIVTTPQEVALTDVRKEINFCKKVGLKIIGVVENMAGFVCPNCKGESNIFPATSGGAQQMAEEMGVRFLGRIPLDPRIAQACDQGKSFLEEVPDSPATAAYQAIIGQIRTICEETEPAAAAVAAAAAAAAAAVAATGTAPMAE